MVVLETERLTLRPLIAADERTVLEHLGAYEMSRFLGIVPHPYTAEDFQAFLAHTEEPSIHGFVMAPRGGGDLLGFISLNQRDQTDPWSLGYWQAREARGHGFMTEAGRAVLSFGFEILGASFIKSGCFIDNPASAGVLLRLGFQETAPSVDRSVARGAVPIVHRNFVLTKDEWRAPHPEG